MITPNKARSTARRLINKNKQLFNKLSMKGYNRREHEDWVIALWVGFFIMWIGVSIAGLTVGIVHAILSAIK